MESIKFRKLESIDLGLNNISNIDILEKVNFKELKKLDLSYFGKLDIYLISKN